MHKILPKEDVRKPHALDCLGEAGFISIWLILQMERKPSGMRDTLNIYLGKCLMEKNLFSLKCNVKIILFIVYILVCIRTFKLNY